jgi:hypothetical protein
MVTDLAFLIDLNHILRIVVIGRKEYRKQHSLVEHNLVGMDFVLVSIRIIIRMQQLVLVGHTLVATAIHNHIPVHTGFHLPDLVILHVSDILHYYSGLVFQNTIQLKPLLMQHLLLKTLFQFCSNQMWLVQTLKQQMRAVQLMVV